MITLQEAIGQTGGELDLLEFLHDQIIDYLPKSIQNCMCQFVNNINLIKSGKLNKDYLIDIEIEFECAVQAYLVNDSISEGQSYFLNEWKEELVEKM